jgi:hypothetical protein
VEISPEGRDLLQRMLLPDPAARIHLEQIVQVRARAAPGFRV